MEIFAEASIFLVGSSFSTLLALVTAYLYAWLPNVQDAHGLCVFHYSLSIVCMHVFFIMYELFGLHPFLQEYCYIMVYLFILIITSMNIWSIIISYNTWTQVKQIGLIESIHPTKRLNCYRFVGYGIPTFYLTLVVCLRATNGNFGLREIRPFDCIIALAWASFFPSMSTPILNIFYFVDSQRRLWNLINKVPDGQNENSRHSSFIATLKMRLNLKLCLTMNIPFVLSSIALLIMISVNIYSPLGMTIQEILLSMQGTFIFLATVAFRKRVIKSFIKYGDKSCLGFVRIPECLKPSATNGDVEETDDEHEERGAPLQSFGNEDET